MILGTFIISIVKKKQIDIKKNISGYIKIYGDLKITYSWGLIDSLTELKSLTSVSRDLIICYNSSLANLDGLENLTSIGQGYTIKGNAFPDP